jgi:hypothetical protein
LGFAIVPSDLRAGPPPVLIPWFIGNIPLAFLPVDLVRERVAPANLCVWRLIRLRHATRRVQLAAANVMEAFRRDHGVLSEAPPEIHGGTGRKVFDDEGMFVK